MEKMSFKNREELKDYISDHTIKRLGAGKDGICSLLDNGSVCKYLYYDYNPEYALQFKDIDVPSFVFATSGAYVDEYIASVFMEYADGMVLDKNKPINIDLSTLASQLDVLVSDLITISDMGILVKDFHCGNTIYDGNSFRVIDTLPYLYIPSGKYKIDNLREVMNRMYDFLLRDIMKNSIVYDKYSFYGRLDYLENPSQYFTELKAFLESLSNQSVNTLEDANMVLKKK